METKTHRHTFYQDENILFEYERCKDVVGLHCEVTNWNHKVLRNAIRVFGNFLNQCKIAEVKQVISLSPNPAFCELFGAKLLGEIELGSKTQKVMQWELD